MMPEISRLYNKAKSRGVLLPGGRLNAYDIRTAHDEWFLTGFKADENNHEAWSGFHAVNTMFVVTEASGISDNIFEAIEGNLQGNSRLLLVFNPNTPIGYAARSQRGERWAKFRLNSLTAPNVLERKIIIPGQVDYEWVVDKLEQWCTRIDKSEVQEELDDFCFEGVWYRPEDLFRKKGTWQVPESGRRRTYPDAVDRGGTGALEMAQRGKPPARIGWALTWPVWGRDATVYCNRIENWVAPFRKHNSGGTADHMRVAGDIITFRRQHPDAFVSIDTIGEGAGVFSRAQELDNSPYIISCKYSEGAKARDKDLTDITGQYKFLNMRAYLFWCIRDWLNPKNNTGGDAAS